MIRVDLGKGAGKKKSSGLTKLLSLGKKSGGRKPSRAKGIFGKLGKNAKVIDEI